VGQELLDGQAGTSDKRSQSSFGNLAMVRDAQARHLTGFGQDDVAAGLPLDDLAETLECGDDLPAAGDRHCRHQATTST
jgi:hypothetical protein